MKKIRAVVLSIICLTMALSLFGCGFSSKGVKGTTWISNDEQISFGKDGHFSATGMYFLPGSWNETEDGMISISQPLLGVTKYYYEINEDGVLTLTKAYQDSSTGEWQKTSMDYEFVREGQSTEILN